MAHLYDIAINFQLLLNNYHCILLSYTSASTSALIICLCVTYFIYAVSKWCRIFEYYLFIISVSLSSCCFGCALSNKSYGSFNKYVYIIIITSAWLWHCSSKFNLTTGVIHSTQAIIYFKPMFFPIIRWLIWCVV